MLGYHVHEKAILLSVVPLGLEAAGMLHCARIFLRLSFIGNYSLLPLIFTDDEYILKASPMLVYLSSSGHLILMHVLSCLFIAKTLLKWLICLTPELFVDADACVLSLLRSELHLARSDI